MALSEYIDILLLALVAGFIGLRLWSVLGQRTGHEQQRDPFKTREAPETGDDKIVQLPRPGRETAVPAGAESLADARDARIPGLTELKLADRNFEVERFLEGARMAYDLIVQAFARGDEGALKPLLAPSAMDSFSAAITARKTAGRTLEQTIVALKQSEIVKIAMVGRVAEVSVRFVSDMITVTRDRAGDVVEGHPSAVRELTDIWTFAREPRSRDPNWLLVGTGAPA